MKKKEREFNFWSLLWTLLLHGGVVLLLLFLHLNKPVLQAESGLPVELGDMGNLDTDYEFTDISELPAPAPVTVPQPTVPDADVTITQDLEETVTMDKVEEESVADQERRVQEADKLVSNVFGNSRNMQSSGEEPKPDDVPGTPGSPQGNSTQGANMGTGSYGTWDLGGRDMFGELPRPAYDDGIQEEGRVVIVITVSPEGNVVGTSINLSRTNTADTKLRSIAVEAAGKAKFNPIDGFNNQTGTITYYFKKK